LIGSIDLYGVFRSQIKKLDQATTILSISHSAFLASTSLGLLLWSIHHALNPELIDNPFRSALKRLGCASALSFFENGNAKLTYFNGPALLFLPALILFYISTTLTMQEILSFCFNQA